MAIDHEVEALIPFNEARSAFPGRKNIAIQTLHRWRLRGVRGVKLETILCGGLRYTSGQAINRFINAQNREETSVDSSGVTSKQRAKQSLSARKALKDAGI